MRPTVPEMYRRIILSCPVSKLFESVLVAMFDYCLSSDDLQFGLKKNTSYCHALFTFNETMKYFVKNGSRIHCA